MSTSTKNYLKPDYEQKQTFIAWLTQNRARLAQDIANLNISVTVDDWLNLLQIALDHRRDLAVILQTHPISLPILSTLFGITIAHLPTSDSNLVRTLFYLQNQVIAVTHQPARVLNTTTNFNETQHRLVEVSTLYTLFQEIVSILNLDELLDHLVKTLHDIIDCRACVIFLQDDTRQYLDIQVASGLNPHWEKTARLKRLGKEQPVRRSSKKRQFIFQILSKILSSSFLTKLFAL